MKSHLFWQFFLMKLAQLDISMQHRNMLLHSSFIHVTLVYANLFFALLLMSVANVLLNLCPLIFCLLLFSGRGIFLKFLPVPLLWEYHFSFMPNFSGTHLGHKKGLCVYVTAIKVCFCF